MVSADNLAFTLGYGGQMASIIVYLQNDLG